MMRISAILQESTSGDASYHHKLKISLIHELDIQNLESIHPSILPVCLIAS